MSFTRSTSLFFACLLFLSSCGTHINHRHVKYYQLEDAEEFAEVKARGFIDYHYFVSHKGQTFELNEVHKSTEDGKMTISGIPQNAQLDHIRIKDKMDSIPEVPVSQMMISYIPQIHLELKDSIAPVGERLTLTDHDIKRITVYYYQKDNTGKAAWIVAGVFVAIAGLIIWGLQNMKFNY